MEPFKVLTVPDPRLKIKAQPVAQVDDTIRDILERMLITMYKEDGIGLAATQVDIHKRLIVIDLRENDQSRPYKLVNPEIIWTSDALQPFPEGCLSVPGQYADVMRPNAIKVRYLDENGTAQVLEAEGLLADCLQHEIDHLNGILFVDHLSSLKRKLLIQKAAKTVTRLDKQGVPIE
jgi:peptide deformylase